MEPSRGRRVSRALGLAVGWSVAAGAAVGLGQPMVAVAVATALGVVLYLALSAPPRPAPRPATSTGRDDWLRGLLEDLSEGVVAFDRHGRVVFANPAACDLLRRRHVPHGTPMVTFSDVPRFRSSVVAALRGAQVSREIEFPGPPRRALLLRASPAAQGAVVVLLDVSAARRLEQSWRDFASNASHELRTPAAAILLSLEAVAEADDTAARRPLVDSALRQARRLATLVSDLLDLVRIESGVEGKEPRRVELGELIAGCVDDQAASTPRLRDEATVVVHGDPAVLGDEESVRRILANLLSNAARYAPGPVAVVAAPRGPWVRLEVRDRGPGVPAEARDLVFERFYRVDAGRSRAVGGNGLGLSIVRELAASLGGRAGVEPNDPVGSVFWVELPRVRSPSSEDDVPGVTMGP